MLTRVEIENFKAIEKLSMDFTNQLTVIVGPNGSGKTSVLQAIDCCGLESVPEKFVRRGATANSELRMFTSYGQIFSVSRFEEPHRRNQRRIVVDDDDMEAASAPPFASAFLKFAASEMGVPSYDEGNPPPLNVDGSNLASVLSSLRLNQPDRFEIVKTCLRKIIPSIREIRFQRVKLPKKEHTCSNNHGDTGDGSQICEEILFDTQQGHAVPADSMSEGTLIALGILTAMALGNGQLAILIDDLDASLHPAAQAELVRVIRSLLSDRPDQQVIATSHSPYLLHSLEFDEVRLTTLRDDGTVACGRLFDHPDFERWKDEMTPGEMWSMFGEKWLADLPKPEPVA